MQKLTQTCQRCGNNFIRGHTTDFTAEQPNGIWHNQLTPVCEACELAASFSKLPDDVQQQVDICVYQCAIIKGIMLIVRTLQIGLHASQDVYSWRYEQLRAANSRNFICSHEDYWSGFYF